MFQVGMVILTLFALAIGGHFNGSVSLTTTGCTKALKTFLKEKSIVGKKLKHYLGSLLFFPNFRIEYSDGASMIPAKKLGSTLWYSKCAGTEIQTIFHHTDISQLWSMSLSWFQSHCPCKYFIFVVINPLVVCSIKTYLFFVSGSV